MDFSCNEARSVNIYIGFFSDGKRMFSFLCILVCDMICSMLYQRPFIAKNIFNKWNSTPSHLCMCVCVYLHAISVSTHLKSVMGWSLPVYSPTLASCTLPSSAGWRQNRRNARSLMGRDSGSCLGRQRPQPRTFLFLLLSLSFLLLSMTAYSMEYLFSQLGSAASTMSPCPPLA